MAYDPRQSGRVALRRRARRVGELLGFCLLAVAATVAMADEFRDRVATVHELVASGEYARALQLADSLVTVAEDHSPPDSLGLALALDARVSAQLFVGRDDAAGAIASARRAVALRERLDGEPSTPLARSLQNLGMLLRQRERFDEAEETLHAHWIRPDMRIHPIRCRSPTASANWPR